jgi:hypothetical protein
MTDCCAGLLVAILPPSHCVEHGDGVQVVAPVGHFAFADGDEGDEAVVVGGRPIRTEVPCTSYSRTIAEVFGSR